MPSKTTSRPNKKKGVHAASRAASRVAPRPPARKAVAPARKAIAPARKAAVPARKAVAPARKADGAARRKGDVASARKPDHATSRKPAPSPVGKAARTSARPSTQANGHPSARPSSRAGHPGPVPTPRVPRVVPPPKPRTIEERTADLERRLQAATPAFLQSYGDNLDMSWIYHDSAIEGVVYTLPELKTAIDASSAVVTDSTLQPACEEIRRHREALNFIRDFAVKKRLPITLDVVKKIYLILHPEEGDVKTVRYRKDIPQHRLYFHEYAPPDKITYKVRQVMDWVNDPETRRTRNAVRVAARAHYDLLRVFPFTHDSGKVARLLMNLLLLRSGYPPAIIHSTERQRYYDALKGASAAMNQIVQEAIENNLGSVEKLVESYEHPATSPFVRP